MHGLWTLYGTLLMPHLERVIINMVWFVIILILWIWTNKLNHWLEINQINHGVLLLLCWYFVSSIDLWLHQQQAYVMYGYILIMPILEIFRITSNIVVLWGTFLIVWRDLQGRFKNLMIWRHVGGAFLIVMLLLTLYYIGLFISLVFVWLFFVDTTVIEDIAQKRASFETAYHVFQFLFAFFVVSGSVLSGYFWQLQDRRLPKQVWLHFGAALALFTRSFAELIIVASYNRNGGPTANDMALGRDVAFGLFTVIFLGFVWALARSVAGHDAGAQHVLDARRDVRQWILDHLEHVTQSGRLPPPLFSTVVSDLRQFINGQGNGQGADIRDLKLDYTSDLEGRFGHHVGR